MMELKVGDYVRTRDGKIGKIANILLNEENQLYSKFYVDIKDYEGSKFDIDDLECEPSPSIIDLLKKKDILIDYKGNIYQVVKVWNNYVFTDKKNEYGQIITLVDYQIKSILTHEQFEAMKYVVGDTNVKD